MEGIDGDRSKSTAASNGQDGTGDGRPKHSPSPLLTPPHTTANIERGYKNLSVLFLIVLLVVGIGFFKTYFSFFPRFQGLPTMAHFHAIGFLSWFALLTVQPLLIRDGRFALHRTLGKFSYVLVPYIALTVIGMTRESYHLKGRAWLLGGQPPSLYFALLGLTSFLLLYSLAIIYRREPDYHMRYMVGTILALLPPALGRFFDLWLKLGPAGAPLPPLIVLAILTGLIVYDKFKTGHVHRAYWTVAAIIILVDVSVPTIPPTHLWQSIASRIGEYLY